MIKVAVDGKETEMAIHQGLTIPLGEKEILVKVVTGKMITPLNPGLIQKTENVLKTNQIKLY